MCISPGVEQTLAQIGFLQLRISVSILQEHYFSCVLNTSLERSRYDLVDTDKLTSPFHVCNLYIASTLSSGIVQSKSPEEDDTQMTCYVPVAKMGSQESYETGMGLIYCKDSNSMFYAICCLLMIKTKPQKTPKPFHQEGWHRGR